ncbi:MAG: hypothetical protein CBARDCOR_3623 [uncultured Caballeronia sp.]|nr:MAG: hypothetical protein CBARDCOR_3623 [uncultured Caballeronia sp.]
MEVTANFFYQEVGDQTVAHSRNALIGRAMGGEEMTGRTVGINYPHGRVGLLKEAGARRAS